MGKTWDWLSSDPQLRWCVSLFGSFDFCNLAQKLWRLTCIVNRIGPEKGVIHIASGAVNNALWDMFARARRKPLWKLVVDMTPVSIRSPQRSVLQKHSSSCFLQEELVEATAFRYITDAITRDEAIALLKAKEAGKKDRETTVREFG